jgi:hypothetical protein
MRNSEEACSGKYSDVPSPYLLPIKGVKGQQLLYGPEVVIATDFSTHDTANSKVGCANSK